MKRIYIVLLIIGIIAAFWVGISSFMTLAEIQRIASDTSAVAKARPFLAFLALALSQCLGMALSLPTKAILTLLAGAVMGPLLGSAATYIGVASGTTALFFGARYLLRDHVTKRLGARAAAIEKRLTSHPIRALIGMRLFITLPFGPITLAAALSSMRYRDFIVGTSLGDLPVIVIYTLAGRQLFQLVSLNQAVSPLTAGLLIAVAAVFIATALRGKSKNEVSAP